MKICPFHKCSLKIRVLELELKYDIYKKGSKESWDHEKDLANNSRYNFVGSKEVIYVCPECAYAVRG